MTDDGRCRHAVVHVAVEDVQVGAADAGVGDVDHDVAWPRRRFASLLYDERPGTEVDGGAHVCLLHARRPGSIGVLVRGGALAPRPGGVLDGVVVLEQPAHPVLGRRHVHECGRVGQDGIAVAEGPQDVGVLLHRALGRPLLDDAAPGPGPDRPSGHPLEHRRQRLVPGGAGDLRVELRVVLHELVLRRRLGHAQQAHLELQQPGPVDPLRREHGRGGLQDPPDLHELELVAAPLHQLGRRPDAVEQQLWAQTGHIGAIASPHVEHLRRDERAHGLPDRVAGGAELDGQVGFGRQTGTGCQPTGGDHVLHADDGRFGEGCPHGPASFR